MNTRIICENNLGCPGEQFASTQQHTLAPGFVIRAESLFQLRLDGVIECSPAKLMPAVFFAQDAKHSQRRISAKLLTDEQRLGLRTQVVNHRLQAAANSIGDAAFGIEWGNTAAEDFSHRVVVSGIDEQGVFTKLPESRMDID